jgi:integrase/recombinase XerD
MRSHLNSVQGKTLDFQTSLRRSEEADPLHKWVGTYNQFLQVLKPFYKWLYAPEQEGKIRKLPPILEGINQLHRKEVPTYTAKDMWSDEDDQLFLKYCEDPLIRLCHTMSRIERYFHESKNCEKN